MTIYRKRDYPGWFDATPDEQDAQLSRLERDCLLAGQPGAALEFAEWSRKRREAKAMRELARLYEAGRR
jgi:hypothetical protein